MSTQSRVRRPDFSNVSLAKPFSSTLVAAAVVRVQEDAGYTVRQPAAWQPFLTTASALLPQTWSSSL